MWKRLDHPNIVAFKGVTLNPLQLVSEWMPGGELREYIKGNPDTNPVNLVGPLLPTSARHLTSRLSCSALPKVLLISTHVMLFTEISKGYVSLRTPVHPF